MKKHYVSPSIQAVVIAHQYDILASSPGIGISSTFADGNGEVLSPQYDGCWDDDSEF